MVHVNQEEFYRQVGEGRFAEHLSTLLFSEIERLLGQPAAQYLSEYFKLEKLEGRNDVVGLSHAAAPKISIELTVADFLADVDLTNDSTLDFLLGKFITPKNLWRELAEARKHLPTIGQDEVLPLALTSVPNPQLGSLLRLVEAEQFVILEGQSSSGKTTLLSQLVQNLSYEEKNSIWIDFSEVGQSAAAAIRHLNSEKPNIIVVDNAQASPLNLSILSQLNTLLLRPSGLDVTIIVATWPTGTQLAESFFCGATVLAADPSALIRTITKAFGAAANQETINMVTKLASGDCLVASILAENHDATDLGAALQKSVLKNVFLNSRPTKADKAAAYVLAALGQFEIPVTLSFLKSILGKSVEKIDERLRLRKAEGRVSLGHRTFCYLTMTALLERNPELSERFGSASDIAMKYIQVLGDRELLGVLSRLDLSSQDLSGSNGKIADPLDQGILVQLWEAFNLLKTRLVRLAELDPTFKDNIASAVFASTVLAHVAEPTWDKVAEYVRNRWKPLGAKGLEPINGPTAERDDFDAIIAAMNQGDPYEQNFTYWERPDQIDKDRFHRSWLAGLLLLFEGTAIKRDNKRISLLKAFAETNVLPSGSFYPQRVSWITASNLRGYASLGLKIGSEQVLEESLLWLRQSNPKGPLLNDTCWVHGTAKWNTVHQTTAMCVAALVEIGVSPSEHLIANAREYLLRNRDDWGSDTEIGRIDVINSLIKAGADWSMFKDDLEEILSWSNDPNTWRSGGAVVATETNEESSKLPYITSLLLQLIWSIMKENVVSLLIGANRRFVVSGLVNLISSEIGDKQVKVVIDASKSDVLSWYPPLIRSLDVEIDSRMKALSQLSRHKSGAEFTELNGALDGLRKQRKRIEEIHTEMHLDNIELRDFEVLVTEFEGIAKGVLGPAWKPSRKAS